jgi:hypothetical protein
MKLNVMQFSPVSRYFLPLGPMYLPLHHTSKHLPSAHILFSNVTEQISNPHTATGKITLVLPPATSKLFRRAKSDSNFISNKT